MVYYSDDVFDRELINREIDVESLKCEVFNPVATLSEMATDELIFFAVNKLPEKERLFVKKCVYSNWSQRKLADKIGISHQSVTRVKRRAFKLLEGLLSNFPQTL